MPRKTVKVPKIRLEDVLRNPKAKRALDRLIKKNTSLDKIWELLGAAVVAQSFSRSHDMFAVDGMTRHQVTNFPGLLRGIARGVEAVRENPHLELKPEADEAILNLPLTLRRYADELEETLRSGRAFMKKNPRYWDMASIFKLKLLNYLQQTTGSPQYSLVAALRFSRG